MLVFDVDLVLNEDVFEVVWLFVGVEVVFVELFLLIVFRVIIELYVEILEIVLLLLLVKMLLDFIFFINKFCKELFSLVEFIFGRFWRLGLRSGFDLNFGLELKVNIGDIWMLLLEVWKGFVFLLWYEVIFISGILIVIWWFMLVFCVVVY